MLPDPEGKRVGSGGATFHVMKYISEVILSGIHMLLHGNSRGSPEGHVHLQGIEQKQKIPG